MALITTNPGGVVGMEMIGGMEYAILGAGTGLIGDPLFDEDNPPQKFTLENPVSLSLDPVPNQKMNAYIKDMGNLTHGVVGEDSRGRLHLLAREMPSVDDRVVPLTDDDLEQMVQSIKSFVGALVTVFRVRVVPLPNRLQDLGAHFALPDHAAVRISLFDAIGWLDWESQETKRDLFLPDPKLWEYAATTGKGHLMPLQTNKWGFRNLSGKLWEWTAHKNYPDDIWYEIRGGSALASDRGGSPPVPDYHRILTGLRPATNPPEFTTLDEMGSEDFLN